MFYEHTYTSHTHIHTLSPSLSLSLALHSYTHSLSFSLYLSLSLPALSFSHTHSFTHTHAQGIGMGIASHTPSPQLPPQGTMFKSQHSNAPPVGGGGGGVTHLIAMRHGKGREEEWRCKEEGECGKRSSWVSRTKKAKLLAGYICRTLQHTAARCNTLQHAATHCRTLQNTAVHSSTRQYTTTHCNACKEVAVILAHPKITSRCRVFMRVSSCGGVCVLASVCLYP